MTTTTQTKVTFQSYLLADVMTFVQGLTLKATAALLAEDARQTARAAALASRLSNTYLSDAFRHIEN